MFQAVGVTTYSFSILPFSITIHSTTTPRAASVAPKPLPGTSYRGIDCRVSQAWAVLQTSAALQQTKCRQRPNV